MKERITYIHGADDAFEPSQLKVSKASFDVTDLKAARDHQITFGLEELPQELRIALSQFQHFHLRWSSKRQDLLASPFNSRISPGLHIFSTPNHDAKHDRFCLTLKKLFESKLKCSSLKESFSVRSASNLFASRASSLEYHQNLESLEDFAIYVEEKICPSNSQPCMERLSVLKTATTLDVDYDRTADSVVLRAYHSSMPEASKGWTRSDLASGSSKTEVGVLAPQEATERDHIRLGGYLATPAQDSKLKPTLFQFPSRHHSMPISSSRYTAAFKQPTGLHPILRITPHDTAFSKPETADPDTCSLHTYLTLPSTIFPDKYQLSNELLLRSLNIRAIQSISGYTDLEAPDYAVDGWGSSMLIELEQSRDGQTATHRHIEIPLHLRYLPPSNASSGTSHAEIPWPVVFWACKANEETLKLSGNPFDRTNLGYDAYFPHDTVYYHFQPDSDDGLLVNTIQVPVLNNSLLGDNARLLELGTSFVVLAGWFWIVWLLFKGWWFARAPVEQQKKLN